MENFYYLIPLLYIFYNEFRVYRENRIQSQLNFIYGFVSGGVLTPIFQKLFLNNRNNEDIENESDSEDEEENVNNSRRTTTNQSSNQSNNSSNNSSNTRIYEATFTIPEITNSNVFSESLRQQLQSQLNNLFIPNTRNTRTNFRPLRPRNRFPTEPVNNNNNNNNDNNNDNNNE